ncbi:hypothetical protein ASE90_18820 [Sphingomonas sp. Leaf67]|nr:hypothetical protein ASE90_18820 [Sphingomonas sp. Leaf67]
MPPASLAAAWRWYALGVQPPRDGDGRQARGIVFEDEHHHRRLGGHDLLEAANAFAIAVVLDAFLVAIG